MTLKINSKTFTLLFLSSFLTTAQVTIETVAFYNLENLFDTKNDPNTLDELSPILEIKHDRETVYQDKLKKLASVISKIGTLKNKHPPAVIGVVEVENKVVLENLVTTPTLQKHNYGIIHIDSPDVRGIDTALLYLKNSFTPTFYEVFPANLYKDHQLILTRDILHVEGYLHSDKIHFLVNHWPSRRGGVQKTSKLRQAIAYTLHKSIQHIYSEDENAKIIVMGDFNDNPTSKSIKKVLLTSKNQKQTNSEKLYNPFERMYKKGHHTLVYKNELFLFDQILFSTALLKKQNRPNEFRFYKAGIYNPSYLTVSNGKYKGHPKRSFGGGNYLGGYSDHYPVYSYLIKENK